MARFGFLVSLYSLLAVMCVCSTTRNKVDWEKETISKTNLFQMEYGADEMMKVAKDTYAEDFVYITPNSVIRGDFGEVADHFEARRNRGYWLARQIQTISACGNTSVSWGTLVFTDGKNQTNEGYNTIVLTHVDGKDKIKLEHFTV